MKLAGEETLGRLLDFLLLLETLLLKLVSLGVYAGKFFPAELVVRVLESLKEAILRIL